MKRVIKASTELDVRDEVKYAVMDRIADAMEQVNDALAFKIHDDVDGYDPEWCATQPMSGKQFIKYNQAINALANVITDTLFAEK